MLKIDASNGTIRVEGFRQELSPWLSYTELAPSDLGRASEVLFPDRGYGDWWIRLPELIIGGANVEVVLCFSYGRLGSLYLVPMFPGPESERYTTDGGAWHLERQHAWLVEHVGVKDGEYSWGSVWNRDNINACRFDVGIFFRPHREDEASSKRYRAG